MNQLLSNSDKAAADATKLALARLQEQGSDVSKIRGAVDAVCQLRGIGPATATAVLCFYSPKLIPFMSDEAIEGAGLERKYTLDVCCELAKRLAEKAAELGGEWTAELVGRAMWAQGLSHVHGVGGPTSETVEDTPSAKSSRSDSTAEHTSRPVKRKRARAPDEAATKRTAAPRG
jgi:hypothetical protein